MLNSLLPLLRLYLCILCVLLYIYRIGEKTIIGFILDTGITVNNSNLNTKVGLGNICNYFPK